MKSSLISNRPFQLVLQLTTSADITGSGYLQNTAAVQALLCNLEVIFHICGRFNGMVLIIVDGFLLLCHFSHVRSGRKQKITWSFQS